MNDLEKLSKEVRKLQERYVGYPCLQRHDLVKIKEEFKKISSIIQEMQEDIACEIDQRETRCGRCGEEYHELNEESNEIEGWCSYCEQVGKE